MFVPLTPNILLLGNDIPFRKYISELLIHEGYHVIEHHEVLPIQNNLNHTKYNLIIVDHKSNGKNGFEWIFEFKSTHPNVPVIIINNHNKIETAIDAIKKGAFDFITKPIDVNKLLGTVRSALHTNISNGHFTPPKVSNYKKEHVKEEIIGNSIGIRKIKSTLEKVAPTEARVMITGENGVGKELVAKWIHEKSLRKNAPLIEVNCAAIPAELIESELFGHEKGSFTSAVKQHIGKFEQAHGGTLFLDEIGDMSLSAQAKVLRVLQEGKITRVGGDKPININVRIITATNKDLLNEVNQNNFRLDLYHRLSVILINVPSLNERIEDIPLLVHHFLNLLANEYHQPVKKIESKAIIALQQHHWSGNIRELHNVIERLIILSGPLITLEDVNNFVAPTYKLSRV